MFLFIDELIGRTIGWAWGLPYRLQIVLLVFIAAWVALLLHELAHWLVAHVVGVRPYSITLGRGPTLFRGRLGDTTLHLALFPLHGEVRFRDEDAQLLGYRNVGRADWTFEWSAGSWRAPLISAAGGLANLLASGAVVAYWAWMPRLSPPSFALFAMCLVVNLMMVLNLMPIRGLDGGRLVVHTAALRRQLAGGG
ncbi:MAG TPA: M50 family metallopeptidase [Gemmatimonadales bacterium]|nr:M50 family metallopeptidase [Gemmatimonadales bacterium]